MDAATEIRPARAIFAWLAGLEAGEMAALWMLTWLGMSAKWELRSFWTAENLMATAFYGDRAVRRGFGSTTLSGLALYLLLYGLLGAVFAAVLRDRVPRMRAVLAGMVLALGWYYVSFDLVFRSVLPLVARLHVERTTLLGHLIYGAALGRYPVYLRRLEGLPEPGEATPESAVTEPVSREAHLEGPES